MGTNKRTVILIWKGLNVGPTRQDYQVPPEGIPDMIISETWPGIWSLIPCSRNTVKVLLIFFGRATTWKDMLGGRCRAVESRNDIGA